MLEFTVDGQEYRAQKLNAFQQLHVARKIARMLPALAAASGEQTDLGPLAEALAGMPAEDVDYVVQTCLSAVHRRQGTLWANVWNAQAIAIMFEDISLNAMLQITFKVIQDSLGNFMQGLVAKAPAASPTV